MFLKIIKIIKFIIKSKKILYPPKQNEILIFDKVGSSTLYEIFPDVLISRTSTISIRGEELNLYVLLINLFKLKLKRKNYIYTYIKIVNPKILITYVDNNPLFYELKKNNQEFTTIFFQNGWRSFDFDVFEKLSQIQNAKDKFHVNYMFVFGKAINKKYSQFVNGKVLNIGSIRNNFYIKRNFKKQKIIVYLSQWIETEFSINNKKYDNKSYSYPCDKLIIPELLKFGNKNNLSIFILTRSKYKSKYEDQEIKYFKREFGSHLNFFERDKYDSSYQIIDSCNLITGVDSTLLYESILRYNKTCIFSVRGNILGLRGFNFGWPHNYDPYGEFWTNIPETKKIKNILTNMQNISEKKLNELYHNINIKNIMCYDEGNQTANDILKYELEK